MATDLGQAYVQIMPSAKGISGSITKAISGEATNAGRSAGSNIARSMANSMGSMGSKLTKAITLPVAGAATAIGGLVGALGFKRLVGVDTAQAQLKGLGYSAEDVERISGQLAKALEGGMMTMGEATSAAANGMAAGIKEGKELTRYIQLLDSAVVGGTGSFDEMNQIFAQTADLGHLTSNNFDMMAMRMPGFSSAMQKHMGVSGQAFRDMLNSGEVTTDDFLDLMDDFAGDMASAYSESWAGMAQNTLAYVGIIGEALLEGLFEDGKKGLANFIEVLKSPTVQNWAQETGEKIREFAQNVVEKIKDLIEWWNGLSDGVQKFIGIAAGIMVALGPVLLIFSKIITTVMSLVPLFKAIGAAIAFITSPIGLVIAAIIAAATLIYIYWEPIKEFFISLWETIKELGLELWETLKEAWVSTVEFLKETWESVKEFFANLWEGIKLGIETVWEAIGMAIETASEAIRTVITTIFNFIKAYILGVLNAYKTMFTMTWNAIKTVITTIINVVKTVITTVFNAIKTTITTVMNTIKTYVTTVWNAIRTAITTVVNAIRSVVSSVFNAIRSVISSVMNGIRSVVSSVWNGIRSTISSVVNTIRSVVSSVFNSLRGIVSGAMGAVRGAISSGMSNALSVITGFASRFLSAGRNIVTSIADGIKGAIGKVTGAIGNIAGKIRDFLPFSPPKTGPLMDIMDVKWGETIAGGINKSENTVANAMDEMLDFDLTQKARFNNSASSNRDSSVEVLLLELINAVREGKNIVMDERTVGSILGPHVTEYQDRERRVRDGFA